MKLKHPTLDMNSILQSSQPSTGIPTASSKRKTGPIQKNHRAQASRAVIASAMLLGIFSLSDSQRSMASENRPVISSTRTQPASLSTPTDVVRTFAQYFNAGDQVPLLGLYDPEAIFIPAPGKPVTTPDGIRSATAQFMELGVPIQIEVRHVYQSGNVALVVSDWTMKGRTASGETLDLSGTATDVLRKTKTGGWRYVVDNPFGGQRAQ